jgi:outer membrane protein assembly factor BamB
MTRHLIAAFVLLSLPVLGGPDDDAKAILKQTGVVGGLVVHLGIGDGKLTAALKQNSGTLVHGLDKDDAKVNAARDWMRASNVYGQVAVEKLTTPVLPYLDGMINLIVVEDQLGLSHEELNRVLVPQGVIYSRNGSEWKKTVKPKDLRMDDWTHYLHGPSGNPVSKDTAVGPPENLQWVGSPRWSRHHDRMSSISGMVSNNGRIFYIMDMGSRISIMLPPHWKLIARDGYNGMILWTKDIPDWQDHLWPLKSGPTQLTRRIVAVDDKLYVTLARATHVTCLDAKTGELVREYPETKFVEEILVEGKQMLVQARKTEEDERKDY